MNKGRSKTTLYKNQSITLIVYVQRLPVNGWLVDFVVYQPLLGYFISKIFFLAEHFVKMEWFDVPIKWAKIKRVNIRKVDS